MQDVTIYTTRQCAYCVMAKRLLGAKGVEYREIRVDEDPAQRDIMLARANGRRTVPQIFIGETHVGGFDDLAALDRRGDLDPLLQSA